MKFLHTDIRRKSLLEIIQHLQSLSEKYETGGEYDFSMCVSASDVSTEATMLELRPSNAR